MGDFSMQLTDGCVHKIGVFPSTRYRGSKRKLLPWIYSIIKEVDFFSALDAFGGTGSVSYLFKNMGKKVVYNDYLRFNFIIGKSIIENSKYTLSLDDVDALFAGLVMKKGFVSNNFSGMYFLDEENEWIDGFMCLLSDYFDIEKAGNEYRKCIAMNAFFQSCLIKRPFNLFHRKNLDIRIRNVERSFGNKITWERDFEYYFRKFVVEINDSIVDKGVCCLSENKNVFELDDVGYDLVYMDPPYVLERSKNESADYLKGYHFLEGVSRYKEWEKYLDWGSNLHEFRDKNLKNYFKKSCVEEAFERLVYKFKQSKIVVSYKYGGVPSVDFIVKILGLMGKNVFVESKHYHYALNKQNGDASLNREYLILGL